MHLEYEHGRDCGKQDKADKKEAINNKRIKDRIRNKKGENSTNEKLYYGKMINKYCALIDYYMVQNIINMRSIIVEEVDSNVTEKYVPKCLGQVSLMQSTVIY